MEASHNYRNIHDNAEQCAEARATIIAGMNMLRSIEPVLELTSSPEHEIIRDILKHSEEISEKIDCLLEFYLKFEKKLFDCLYQDLR